MIFWGTCLRTRHRPPPQRVSRGGEEVMRHVNWFGEQQWRISASLTSECMPSPILKGAVAEFKAEGLIKPTGRIYRQDYVVFLRAVAGRSRSYANILTPCVQPSLGRTDTWSRILNKSNVDGLIRLHCFTLPISGFGKLSVECRHVFSGEWQRFFGSSILRWKCQPRFHISGKRDKSELRHSHNKFRWKFSQVQPNTAC